MHPQPQFSCSNRDAQLLSPIGAISDGTSFRLAPAVEVERGWSPNLWLARPLEELNDGIGALCVARGYAMHKVAMMKRRSVAEETRPDEIDSTSRHTPRSWQWQCAISILAPLYHVDLRLWLEPRATVHQGLPDVCSYDPTSADCSGTADWSLQQSRLRLELCVPQLLLVPSMIEHTATAAWWFDLVPAVRH